MNAQLQSTSSTREFVINEETWVALMSTSSAGHVNVRLQAPDGTTHSVGNWIYWTEDRAVAAATRAAQRIVSNQPRMPALRKKGL